MNTVLFVGKRALVCGYGKDCASALCFLFFAECDPFCSLQACFEDQASEDRFVFPVGHGVIVPTSGLQVRRLFRTGELDKKWRNCTILHSVRRSMSLLKNERIKQVSRLRIRSGHHLRRAVVVNDVVTYTAESGYQTTIGSIQLAVACRRMDSM